MAHIAFLAVPAHGHVNPSLTLVAELVRRGHRVTFPTTADFAPQVTAAGAAAPRHESTFPAAGDTGFEWPESDQEAALRLFLDEFLAVTPQVADLFAGDRPDLVVHDIGGWQGPVLAAEWGVPAIQLSPTYVAYEGMAEDFGLDLDAEPTPGMRALQREFDDFVAARGGDPETTGHQAVWYLPRRCIVTIPRSWQLHGDRVGEQYTFVGPDVAARQGEWTPPDERPVLLVSLGSAYTDRPAFYRECVAAFGDLDWHVLLSVGEHVDPADLGDVPPNIEVVRWVPQVAVLARAAAFVTHAGMGSTMEALAHGVPMVAVPQAVDQFLNGARIAELNVGEHVPMAEATAQRLREAVLRVSSDPVIAANAAKFRDEIRESGGAAAAADIVESHLA